MMFGRRDMDPDTSTTRQRSPELYYNSLEASVRPRFHRRLHNEGRPSSSEAPVENDGSGHQEKLTSCNICREEDQITRLLKCGHHLCRPCICGSTRAGFSDRISWPPKCCYYSLDDQDVAWGGDAEMFRKYKEISREMNRDEPKYCCRPQCSKLLDDDDIDPEGIATCKACGTRTCVGCKQDYHPGRQCDKSIDINLERTIKAERWQQCRRCGRIISLLEGCNNMRCLCGHHFCYYCGENWGECACSGYYPPLDYMGFFPQPQRPLGREDGGRPIHDEPANHSDSIYRDLRLTMEYEECFRETLQRSKWEQKGKGAVEGKGKEIESDWTLGGSADSENTEEGDFNDGFLAGNTYSEFNPLDAFRRELGRQGHDWENDGGDENGYRRDLQPPDPFHQQLPDYLRTLSRLQPRRLSSSSFGAVPHHSSLAPGRAVAQENKPPAVPLGIVNGTNTLAKALTTATRPSKWLPR